VAPRDDRDKARQVRFLQARGYPLAIALAVLRRAGVNDADEPS
jgi:SOS response regulatory protein OraA/RecX